jgi:hypothetical protein
MYPIVRFLATESFEVPDTTRRPAGGPVAALPLQIN